MVSSLSNTNITALLLETNFQKLNYCIPEGTGFVTTSGEMGNAT